MQYISDTASSNLFTCLSFLFTTSGFALMVRSKDLNAFLCSLKTKVPTSHVILLTISLCFVSSYRLPSHCHMACLPSTGTCSFY